MSDNTFKRMVIITGMSGSGKSTGVRALEDAGFFCIDNLPAPLLLKVAELSGPDVEPHRLAFVIDVREAKYLEQLPQVIDEAQRIGHRVEVIFLESSDEVLIRRYSETRRKHPLSPRGSVAEGIAKERALLKELKERASLVVDTSDMNVHELKKIILGRFSSETVSHLSLNFMSFGFRYGVPAQADMVLDVRFLPNPFFEPHLKLHTGLEKDVSDYVLHRPETFEFLEKTEAMLRFLIPHYQREGKAYLTVALGCTGGKHRSVAVAHALKEKLSNISQTMNIVHRDIARE